MNIIKYSLAEVHSNMDYIPNVTKDEMAEDREKIAAILKEYMDMEGYQLSTASRFSFSLDAFHYQYRNSAGNMDNIKIELNSGGVISSHCGPGTLGVLYIAE